jgi:hypothetical protein
VSYLINNELIWVSIPKCASYSIERALRNSKLKLDTYDPNIIIDEHLHVPLTECLSLWGNKETVCITRDYVHRWMSSLNFIWDKIEFESDYTLIRKWEDVDNEFLYKMFDTKFLNDLHSFDGNDLETKNCFLKLVKEKYDILKKMPFIMITLVSPNFFKSNRKCTYEFDIKEIDKFVDFIEDRFGERLIIESTNQSTKRPNKIIINDELKSFILENFENRFKKRNQLI